ncbi:spore germination protein [Metabacillus idriensis]|uniref:Spore germination protein n=1 Tax=Metabacillus idriensis TaxID=324768 RepID=A0A6I2M8P9_9BACI|nr:spore germination protein [Metabacillus idriensis]MCM3597567.1 spore germination protein [Metabacillus idriensis]MRX54488.1 spore germination protein [Metabacillus idriensis]
MFSLFKKKKQSKQKAQQPKNTAPPKDTNIPVSSHFNVNIAKILTHLDHTDDLGQRKIMFKGKQGLLLYFVPLMKSDKINQDIIAPLQHAESEVVEDVVAIASISKTKDIHEAIHFLCKGKCLLLLEDLDCIYAFDSAIHEARSVEQTQNEKVVRGSHEGFTENMDINLNLIRQRILDGSLVVKYLEIGNISRTRVAVLYINHLTNKELIEKVLTRLKSIKIDAVDTPGIIEESIEDSPYSLFPQILSTERPDKVVSNLFEGRVVILPTGSSSALIAPVNFFSFFQTPEDYNSRWIFGSFYRLIRILGFFISISLPALYIATISYHYELIPNDLILTVKSSLENVPLPPIAEALLMVIILELLREAALRLPTSISQTIGVVGGLVIGTAIVEANLVSNMMIIVIALTAIASFVVPSNEMSTALRLVSFPMMFGAAIFGYLGIVFIFVIILMHLSLLESFGTPYFYPLAPMQFDNLKDSVLRMHHWYMNDRPKDTSPQKVRRQNSLRNWSKHENES